MLGGRRTATETTGACTLPVVFALGGESLVLDLTLAADATVSELIDALAGGAVDAGTGLVVDGRAVAVDRYVGDTALRPGSRLELVAAGFGSDTRTLAPPAVVEVAVVGGLRAGPTFGLAPGRHVIGRGDHADVRLDAPTVSEAHAVVDVATSGAALLVDAGSTNGTLVDGRFAEGAVAVDPNALVHTGAVQLRLRRPGSSARRRPGPFNRPPRSAPAEPAPVAVPARPPTQTTKPRFAWTAVLLPLATGAVLAVVWDPRMAVFALLSPVMAIGHWWEERRRSRRDRVRAARDMHDELDRFRDALREATHHELARRETVAPDPDALARRAQTDDTRLWQRRAFHDDAFVVRVGVGDDPWVPPLTEERSVVGETAAVLAAESTLRRAPVLLDLSPGNVAGIVAKDRIAAVAVARSIALQLAVHLGPADVRLAILTDPSRTSEWSAALWLPHTLATGEAAPTRLIAADSLDVDTVVRALTSMHDHIRVVVVDADGLTMGRPAPVRSLLAGAAGPVAGIVIAPTVDDLPACCTHLIELSDEHGTATLTDVATRRDVDTLLATGLDPAAAEQMAMALAGVEDPEDREAGGELPTLARAVDLLATDANAEDVASRWSRHDGTGPAQLPVLLGATEAGPLVIDLVTDGPHGLLGGTTGAGKSELLRTIVASLAASVSPARLNIVLVDYKGGSAFDACARLPHVVGVVTDLDEHLGQRALVCLEAELAYRERMLRAAGAVDLAHHEALRPHDPLPRLLVVIDEFATLAAELPDFVDSLVGIAQRGRSLGVHLLLATQRPAGAVKENIRANTNLRIALRVQDATDSNDILGVPDAATIGRQRAGRGFVRLGANEIVGFQAAMVSTRTARQGERPVVVQPRQFGPASGSGAVPLDTVEHGPTDLERLVDAALEAARIARLPTQRRPWPEALAADVALSTLATGAIGVVDDPANQRTHDLEWAPERGNALVYGAPGSGTTSAIEAIAVALATTNHPRDLHLYALDYGMGRLGTLARLPHTGAVIGAGETDRQQRLIRFLRDEIDGRRASGGVGDKPKIVVLLDGWSAFAATFDDVDGMEVRDALARVVANGPAAGVSVMITAQQPNEIPLALSGVITEKLVLRLADRHDASAFGLTSRDLPAPLPGRGVHLPSGLEVQVARVDHDAWLRVRAGARVAPAIGSLPARVALDGIGSSTTSGDTWSLGIGIADTSLGVANLVFRPDDHALVLGPTRSGRSTTLLAIAFAALRGEQPAQVSVIAPRPSPLRDAEGIARLATNAAEALDLLLAATNDARPQLVLVDDADAYDDPDGAVTGLLRTGRANVHVVAACRTDALRGGYGHWARELRRCRLGIVLAPQPEDGDLLGTTFPRRNLPTALPGRGLLVVDGRPEIIQVGAT